MDYIEALLHELPAGGQGRRTLEVVTRPNPAAGADWSFTVPGRELWHPVSVRALLAASAAVANRQPRLILDDGAVIFCRVRPAGNITAGENMSVSWYHGSAAPTGASVGGTVDQPLPQVVMLPGWRLRVDTAALDALDQWSEIALLVEKAQLDPPALQARYAGHRAAGFAPTTEEEG